MSFKSELNRTVSLLRTARNAILGRGGAISATAGLKDLSDAIYNIPADASLVFQTDEDIAYRKIVPVGAEEYAQITCIGGMTYKSKNLILFPYSESEKTVNGITFSPQADGSIIVNGTATSRATFKCSVEGRPIKLQVDKTYTLSGCPSGGARTSYCLQVQSTDYTVSFIDVGSGNTSTAKTTDYYCYINISSGTVANNLVFKPMFNEGSTAEAFEVQYKGLRDTKVLALESESANLLPRATRNGQTINGVTFTVQDDNSIIVNGTATATASFEILRGYMGECFALEKDGTYTLSGCPEGGSTDTYRLIVQDLEFSQNFMDTGSGYTGITKKDKYYAFIRITAGYTANNLVFKPMLNRGSTVLPYSPYGTVDTLPIPEAVQSLDGYGRGVNADYYNYIEWRNGRAYFVQNTYRKVFDGTEEWQAIADTSTMVGDNLKRLRLMLSPIAYGLGNQKVSPFICNLYTEITAEQTYFSQTGCAITSSSALFVCDPKYQVSSAWKTHLAELYANGNPFVVEYALAEPIETDITDLLRENFLKVQGGGTIKFENEYEYDVPSTINYITKVGG
jgi:hypothetical protein